MCSNVGYYTEIHWSTRITRSRWNALHKHKNWLRSIEDIGFELGDSYKSNVQKNVEVALMDNIPSMIISKSLQKRTCNLSYVEGWLNSKHNDIPSKPNGDSLNRFIDF